MNENPSKKIKIALLATEESSAAVIFGMHEVLSGVGLLWDNITGENSKNVQFDVKIVSRSGKRITNYLGIDFKTQCSIYDKEDYDIVIVPDQNIEGCLSFADNWRPEIKWLIALSKKGTIVTSVCTGSILLAESGLLNGLAATSHWSVKEVFQKHYPQILLQSERIIVPTGKNHNIITSGGSSSWVDLTLYLIARFCNSTEAQRMSKIYLLGDRQDGQLPFAAFIRPTQHSDNTIANCQVWLANNYTQTNLVTELQNKSGLTKRTFSRRFKRATGYTPIEYIQSLRIEEAKQLLETSGQTIEQISHDVGYEDLASFRRLFKRLTGVSPKNYRYKFRNLRFQ